MKLKKKSIKKRKQPESTGLTRQIHYLGHEALITS